MPVTSQQTNDPFAENPLDLESNPLQEGDVSRDLKEALGNGDTYAFDSLPAPGGGDLSTAAAPFNASLPDAGPSTYSGDLSAIDENLQGLDELQAIYGTPGDVDMVEVGEYQQTPGYGLAVAHVGMGIAGLVGTNVARTKTDVLADRVLDEAAKNEVFDEFGEGRRGHRQLRERGILKNLDAGEREGELGRIESWANKYEKRRERALKWAESPTPAKEAAKEATEEAAEKGAKKATKKRLGRKVASYGKRKTKSLAGKAASKATEKIGKNGARYVTRQGVKIVSKEAGRGFAKSAALHILPRLGLSMAFPVGTVVSVALIATDPLIVNLFRKHIAEWFSNTRTPGLDEPPENPRTYFLPLCYDGNRDDAIIDTDKELVSVNDTTFDFNPDSVWPQEPDIESTGTFDTYKEVFDTVSVIVGEAVQGSYNTLVNYQEEQQIGALLQARAPFLEAMSAMPNDLLQAIANESLHPIAGFSNAYASFRDAIAQNRLIIAESGDADTWLWGLMANPVDLVYWKKTLDQSEMLSIAAAMESSANEIDEGNAKLKAIKFNWSYDPKDLRPIFDTNALDKKTAFPGLLPGEDPEGEKDKNGDEEKRSLPEMPNPGGGGGGGSWPRVDEFPRDRGRRPPRLDDAKVATPDLDMPGTDRISIDDILDTTKPSQTGIQTPKVTTPDLKTPGITPPEVKSPVDSSGPKTPDLDTNLSDSGVKPTTPPKITAPKSPSVPKFDSDDVKTETSRFDAKVHTPDIDKSDTGITKPTTPTIPESKTVKTSDLSPVSPPSTPRSSGVSTPSAPKTDPQNPKSPLNTRNITEGVRGVQSASAGKAPSAPSAPAAPRINVDGAKPPAPNNPLNGAKPTHTAGLGGGDDKHDPKDPGAQDGPQEAPEAPEFDENKEANPGERESTTISRDGKTFEMGSSKASKLAELIHPTDGSAPLSLREAMAEAGYDVPDPGANPGKPVSPMDLQPGDMVIGEKYQGVFVGDGMVLTSEGLKPLPEVAVFGDSPNQGFFRPDAAEVDAESAVTGQEASAAQDFETDGEESKSSEGPGSPGPLGGGGVGGLGGARGGLGGGLGSGLPGANRGSKASVTGGGDPFDPGGSKVSSDPFERISVTGAGGVGRGGFGPNVPTGD